MMRSAAFRAPNEGRRSGSADERMRKASGWILLVIGMILAGCVSQTLPVIRAESLGQTHAVIPEGAAPVFFWTGSRAGLKTYWMDQAITTRVRAWAPASLKSESDIVWEASAQNGEGKPIPFVGVLRRYRSEHGTELTVLVPPLDLMRTPDGLYLVVLPNVTVKDKKLACLQPVAQIREIRQHVFKPFRVGIPLVPEEISALTPAPEPLPETPAGTPIPGGG